jgi:alpha-tubulin suppressor-like RCC1 family protein
MPKCCFSVICLMVMGFTGPGGLGNALAAVELDMVEGVASSGSVFDGGHRCAHDRLRVWCWGDNRYGQLGLGHSVSVDLASHVSDLRAEVRVRDLALGHWHSCALVDEKLYCWGLNHAGQLGTGDVESRLSPAFVIGSRYEVVTSVGAGAAHTCATISGVGYCWGGNSSGQVGVEPEAGSIQPDPILLGGLGRIDQWALGENFTCGLRDGGDVWCWGDNTSGQLGDGTLVSRAAPAPVEDLPIIPMGLVAGRRHICATDGESVYCWGANEFSQAGAKAVDGETDSRQITTPVAVAGLEGEVVDLALARNRSCAAIGSEVYCWGFQGFGEPGDPRPGLVWQSDRAITALPEEECVLSGQTVTCINNSGRGRWASERQAHHVRSLPLLPLDSSAKPRVLTGAHNACVLFNEERLYCWGNNTFGQLGQSDFEPRSLAVELFLPDVPQISDVAIGSFHLCAKAATGLYCWGDNFFGELGIDDIDRSATPMPVPIETQPDARLIAGFGYTCQWQPATQEPLLCWGRQLPGMQAHAPDHSGTGTEALEIPVPGSLESVQAGRDHLCMLVEEESGQHEVFCLGDIRTSSDYLEIPSPVRFELRRVNTGLGAVREVQGAAFTHCAMASDKVVCWGMDHASPEGMRGISRPPQAVVFPDDIDPSGPHFRFAVGGRHTCASGESGQPQCIGLPLALSCNHAVGVGEIGPGSGFAGCSEEEFNLTPAERDWMELAGLPGSPLESLHSGDQYSCSIHGPRMHCWGWGEAVTVERRFDFGGQPNPVLRRGSIEPTATASVALDSSQPCPAFLVGRASLLDPQDQLASGSWGMEMLLRDGDTRLHGGLNFGGFARFDVPGFAAFRIDNGGRGPQLVRIQTDGAGDLFVLEVASSVPLGSPQQLVYSQMVTLGETEHPVEVTLEEGFHVIRMRPQNSVEPALFLVSARTFGANESPASFRYGAVVGGYLEPGLSGFAGVCTDGAHSLKVRAEGRKTRGVRGAGDLRIEVENRTSGEVIIDSARSD